MRPFHMVNSNCYEKLFLSLYQLQLYGQLLDECVENTGDEDSEPPQFIDDIIVNSLVGVMRMWKEEYPESLVVLTWNLPGSNKTTKPMIKSQFKSQHKQLIEITDISFFQEFSTGEDGACDYFVKTFDKEYFAIQNLKRFNKKSDDFGVIMWNEKYSVIEEEFGFQGMKSINPTMINIHLSYTITKDRNEELEQLFEYINKKLSRDSFVIAGDFNVELNDELIEEISHVASLDKSNQITTKSGRKLDHVIFSNDFQCKLCIVPELLAFSESNHFPKIVFLRRVDEENDQEEENGSVDSEDNEDIATLTSKFHKTTL